MFFFKIGLTTNFVAVEGWSQNGASVLGSDTDRIDKNIITASCPKEMYTKASFTPRSLSPLSLLKHACTHTWSRHPQPYTHTHTPTHSHAHKHTRSHSLPFSKKSECVCVSISECICVGVPYWCAYDYQPSIWAVWSSSKRWCFFDARIMASTHTSWCWHQRLACKENVSKNYSEIKNCHNDSTSSNFDLKTQLGMTLINIFLML